MPGPSVNRHHLIPKLKGGTEAVEIHKVCHSKIHSLWTEVELRDHFHTWDRIGADPRVVEFVAWVANKPPDFTIRTATSNDHRRPRRGRRR